MGVKEPRTYGGQTTAERSARRRAALVEAAFALIAEDGGRQLRIERICSEAGLNKRYFYESFADLDAVIAAVMEHLTQEAITATLAPIDQAAPRPVWVRSAIAALVEHATEDPRRARVLFGETAASEAASRYRVAALHELAVTAAAQGRSTHDLADDPIGDLAAAVLVGGTSQAVLDWLDGRLTVPLDQFIDDLTALWLVVGDGAEAHARMRDVPLGT